MAVLVGVFRRIRLTRRGLSLLTKTATKVTRLSAASYIHIKQKEKPLLVRRILLKTPTKTATNVTRLSTASYIHIKQKTLLKMQKKRAVIYYFTTIACNLAI